MNRTGELGFVGIFYDLPSRINRSTITVDGRLSVKSASPLDLVAESSTKKIRIVSRFGFYWNPLANRFNTYFTGKLLANGFTIYFHSQTFGEKVYHSFLLGNLWRRSRSVDFQWAQSVAKKYERWTMRFRSMALCDWKFNVTKIYWVE